MHAKKYVRLETASSFQQLVGDRATAPSNPTHRPSSGVIILGYFTNFLLTLFVCAQYGAICFFIGTFFDATHILRVDSKSEAAIQGALGGALVSPLAFIASVIHYHRSIRYADPPVDDTNLWTYHKTIFLSFRHLFYMLIAGSLAGGVGYARVIGGARILDAFGFGLAGGLVFTTIVAALAWINLAFREYCLSREGRPRTTWLNDCGGCDCSGCGNSGCDFSSCNCSGCDSGIVVVLIVVAVIGVILTAIMITFLVVFIDE